MSGRDDLDPYEDWTETALTPLLGPLRHTDLPGAAEGTHDFEADLPNDEIAAIEVTSEVDGERLGLAAALNKSDRRFVLSGSSRLWVVRLLPTARVRAAMAARLGPLLNQIEALGLQSTLELSRSQRDLWASLHGLGIESVSNFAPRPGSDGLVLIQGGMNGGRSWRGRDLDAWLGEFFASPRGASKVAKLTRAAAVERHLVIVLDPESAAGIGLGLSLNIRHADGAGDFELPTITPPSPVTRVWILPLYAREALLWTSSDGWRIPSLDA